MTLSKRIEEMLRDPHSHIHAIEITPEYKERLNRICAEMLDELIKRTKGPPEAYMVLQFLVSSLEETHGFTGFTAKDGEEH